MNRSAVLTLMLFALPGLVPGLSDAEVYKWVDEDGAVHYGDKRPDQAAETVEIQTTPTTDAAAVFDRNQQVNEALRIVSSSRERREEADRERDEASAERQRRQLECQQLTDYRNRLAAGGFLYRKSDQERKALSDEELAAEVAELDQSFAENCTARR